MKIKSVEEFAEEVRSRKENFRQSWILVFIGCISTSIIIGLAGELPFFKILSALGLAVVFAAVTCIIWLLWTEVGAGFAEIPNGKVEVGDVVCDVVVKNYFNIKIARLDSAKVVEVNNNG